MQDPNEDTEWNDILRAKGIIPEKPKEKEITEDDIVNLLEQTVKEKSSGLYNYGHLEMHQNLFSAHCLHKKPIFDHETSGRMNSRCFSQRQKSAIQVIELKKWATDE